MVLKTKASASFVLAQKADAAAAPARIRSDQLFSARSTALSRSAVHSLEAITMTTRLSFVGDDSVLHVALCLGKLGEAAVESHLVLLVGGQLAGNVLGLAVGSLWITSTR